MIGYKFNTEQEAINAFNLCNQYYGYPKPNCETENWAPYYVANYDNPKFYYIIYDPSLTAVLGEPIEFTVTQPELN